MPEGSEALRSVQNPERPADPSVHAEPYRSALAAPPQTSATRTQIIHTNCSITITVHIHVFGK